jgi:hypothetical protein
MKKTDFYLLVAMPLIPTALVMTFVMGQLWIDCAELMVGFVYGFMSAVVESSR